LDRLHCRRILSFGKIAVLVFLVRVFVSSVCIAGQAGQNGISPELSKYLALDEKQKTSIVRLNRQYTSQERTSTQAELEKINEAISELLTAEQKTRLKALAGAKCDGPLQQEARSLRLLQDSQTSPNARGGGFGGNTPKSKTSAAVCEGTSGKLPPTSPPQ
jgi:hypothetical protein